MTHLPQETITKDEFIREYVKALKEENAAVFAGAGLSRAAGYVDWKELLREIANELSLDIDREHDLLAIAQYHYNHAGGRGRLNKRLVEEFSEEATLTRSHQILAELPIDTYWTTNYDRMIERALQSASKTADVKHAPSQLPYTKPRRDAVVYKMHGDVDHPSDAILTKNDFELFSRTRELFSTALRGDLVSKTFLFIGFSFTDPNLDHILARIRILLEENQRQHYCFMKRENDEYVALHQQYRIRDLKRYAIQTVLLDAYDEIPDLLETVRNLYKSGVVLISGSISDYGPWGEARVKAFIHNLAQSVSALGVKIVTGFGLGVGSGVINGVLDHMDKTQHRSLDDYLILMPFPQYVPQGKEIDKVWDQYRRRMIKQAGVVVFVFGNKIDPNTNQTIVASGVMREFDIAAEERIRVLPIRITGYAAQELYDRVNDEHEKFLGDDSTIHDLYGRLGSTSLSDEQVIDVAVQIIRKWQQV